MRVPCCYSCALIDGHRLCYWRPARRPVLCLPRSVPRILLDFSFLYGVHALLRPRWHKCLMITSMIILSARLMIQISLSLLRPPLPPPLLESHPELTETGSSLYLVFSLVDPVHGLSATARCSFLPVGALSNFHGIYAPPGRTLCQ